jgi:Bifunctional DNA primase/polymerase, N-terminal/AAA domain
VTPEMKQFALEALDRGLYVFPLAAKSKVPMKGTAGFKDASAHPTQIEDWWEKMPAANIGIACGASGVIVLDFDDGQPPADLPKTYAVRTKRGFQLYFWGNHPSTFLYDESGKKVGDLKSQGGYILAAGSIHPDGPVYTVADNSPIVDAPMDIIARLTRKPASATESGASNISALIASGAKIPRGQHDITLTAVAGKWRSVGLEYEEIVAGLIRFCEQRCEGYGSDYIEMCQKIAKSVCRYSAGDPTPTVFVGSSAQPAAPSVASTEPITSFVVNSGDEFLKREIPPRRAFLELASTGEPVIFEQSINQTFAWRGSGKTCFGLGLVRALATGGELLCFKAPQPVRVLYVEGELPNSQIQERWRNIVGNTNGYAFLCTIDDQPNGYGSLASPTGRARIEATLADLKSKGTPVQVLFLDSVSTLFNIAANEEETWTEIQDWFINLRSRGITICFAHHAGKTGLSRSHSKSEDMLDLSVKLSTPENNDPSLLHCTLEVDKARNGLSLRPFDFKMHREHSDSCACHKMETPTFCPGDSVRWEMLTPPDTKKLEAEQLFAAGNTVQEVADHLELPFGTVNRWRTDWGKKRKASEQSNVVSFRKGRKTPDRLQMDLDPPPAVNNKSYFERILEEQERNITK